MYSTRKDEKHKILGDRHRWEANIRMDLREVWQKGMDWMHLAQDRDECQSLVNTVMNLGVPYKVGNFLTS